MILAILRAQLLSMRVRRGGRRAGLIFSLIAGLFFYALFTFIALAIAAFFSSPDLAPKFLPALSGGLLAAMLYWQLSPVITASFGASLDLKKLLAYPIPHRTLFTVEVLLRIATCGEMLIVIGGACVGLLRNPVFGAKAAPMILGGALLFALTNILLSAGTRNLLERLFQRSRMREIMTGVFVLVSVAPQILLFSGVKSASFVRFIPAQFFWPWSAPAHLMLGESVAPGAMFGLVWLAGAFVFSRWQFERGIRYDQTRPAQTTREARGNESIADRAFRLPARFLNDPVAAIVEKELRTLTRIPRFRLVYLMSCFFGIIVFLPHLRRSEGPSPFMQQAGLPIMAIYGLLMIGQISYWNAFGFDRSAVQGYFSWPLRLRDVLIAKNISVIFLVIPQILLISLAARLIHIPGGPAKIAETIFVTAIASLYWLALGNIMSVRIPRALDPEKMNQMSGKLQALSMLGAPFVLLPLGLAYWSRWFFESEGVFAGIVLLSAFIGAVFYWVGLDSATAMASQRREAIITELSSTEGPLSIT